jgi:hypothetical protein
MGQSTREPKTMLDTLKYAKRLQEAGFTAPQAEAQAQALWEAIESTVATKQDLRELEARLGGRMDALGGRMDALEARMEGRMDALGGRVDALEARMEGRFKEVDGRFRLQYWMTGFNLALTVAVLLKLLTG